MKYDKDFYNGISSFPACWAVNMGCQLEGFVKGR
jgi:hypothetical protein